MKTTFTQFKTLFYIGLLIMSVSNPIFAQFVPGEGGSLPTFPTFTAIPNKVAGFVVETSHRSSLYFGSTHAVVDMRFPEPSVFEADTYTLQYLKDAVSDWTNYKIDGVDATSNYNNFSISPDGDYKFRLLLNGGPLNGYTSNEEFAPLSAVLSKFTGFSMDEGLFISGIMAPFAGRGIEMTFNVTDLVSLNPITGSLTYQWYRVNPVTYAMTEIAGATSLKYITTQADAGYKLCIVASGDGIKVGGFRKIISSWDNFIANNSFASSVNNNGFTLNLHKTTNTLTINDLELKDKNYETVAITSITAGSNAGTYNITATLDQEKSPYSLFNKSIFWRIVQEMNFGGEMSMTMQGLNIEFPTNVENFQENNIKLIIENGKLHYNSEMTVNQIDIFDLTGKNRLKFNPELVQGQLNISSLENGIFIIRITTQNGEYNKKISIFRK